MLELILPAGVESQECFGEPPGGVLFPEEEQVIAHAVPARRREYAAVRSCARACLARLGYPPAPILPGVGGAPTWPAGMRGSMTHCAGYAAAAVGLSPQISAIGIDAEPDAPLPDGVLDLVATPAEQDRLPNPVDGSWTSHPSLTARTGTGCCSAPRRRSTKHGSRWLVSGSTTSRPKSSSTHTTATFTAQLSRDGLIIDGRPTPSTDAGSANKESSPPP